MTCTSQSQCYWARLRRSSVAEHVAVAVGSIGNVCQRLQHIFERIFDLTYHQHYVNKCRCKIELTEKQVRHCKCDIPIELINATCLYSCHGLEGAILITWNAFQFGLNSTQFDLWSFNFSVNILVLLLNPLNVSPPIIRGITKTLTIGHFDYWTLCGFTRQCFYSILTEGRSAVQP